MQAPMLADHYTPIPASHTLHSFRQVLLPQPSITSSCRAGERSRVSNLSGLDVYSLSILSPGCFWLPNSIVSTYYLTAPHDQLYLNDLLRLG
jgi:hypothetical protein